MMEVSECEIDAGASPSVPSDESSSASSTSVLKTTSASKRASSSTSVLMTPPSSGRRVPRRKIKVTPTAVDSCEGVLLKDENTPVSTRKKKRLEEMTTPDDPQEVIEGGSSQETKRTKRRKTRSQRNLLTGKAGAVAAEGQVPKGEEAVALAEIDKVLEEKASKNNLSATNVKSIIRHVITNNMVQKMMMSASKKRVETGDVGGSSDEDGLVGPKMTRSKTKELMENQQVQLWPNCYSPVKMLQLPVSETQLLTQNDLPDDSSGDEYVPKEADFSELLFSDDESSGVGSHTSDLGSPSPSISRRLRRSITRRNLHTPTPEVKNFVEAAEHVFKTPPPRAKETREESAICKRTRSKFPLKDTPLEALERELVPPDVTTDMYDDGCGVETDNEDWTDFLKKFWNEAPSISDANEVDDEGDPEYNVMEDEDVHDQEELRRDRAVKVPKKELNDLISELFEPGFLSEDDMEDLSSLTGFTPLPNETDGGGGADASFPEIPEAARAADIADAKKIAENEDQITAVDDADIEAQASANEDMDVRDKNENDPNPATSQQADDQPLTDVKAPLFRDEDLQFLEYQMRQHVQLLAQSYVLTASSEDAELRAISKSAKGMVNEIKNFADVNTTYSGQSCFAVGNLDSAWNIVNAWPQKSLQQSPIKKRILEDKYINESRFPVDEKTLTYKRFPRHIVKVIAEHNAFLYNHLLPESLLYSSPTSRVTFSVYEDILLVNALEDLKSTKMGVAQMAEIISRLLLVVHYPKSVYHRIKNLRRNKLNCDEIIKRYFADGVLPEVDRAILEADPQPLVGRSKKGLSRRWLEHLMSLEELPSHQWRAKPIRKSKKKENSVQAAASKKCTINRVFPNGTYLFDNKDSSVEAIPILNANGQPGAVIYVPKVLLTQNEAVAVQAPANLATTWINQEPRVADEAEIGIKYDNLDLVPSWNQNLPVLNTITNLANFQPPAVTVSAFVSTIQPQLFYPPGFGYHVVQPVGKPFSLNELGCPLPLPPSGGAQFIDLASLQTPMKAKIFEKASEPVSEVKSDIKENNLIDDKNGDNTPEYDVPVIEDHLDTSATPEVCAALNESEDNGDDSKREKSDGKSSAGGSSGNVGNKSSTTKTDGGSSEKKETSEYSSESGNLKSSCSKRTSSKPGKGDDSEDENEKRGNRKRPLPNDCTKDDANDDDNEDGNNNSGPENEKSSKKAVASGSVPLPTVSPGTSHNKSTAQQSLSSPTYTRGPQHKKAKRSPGNTQANRSRTSKYNVASAEKLLQDDPETFDDVADAYMETYLAKVQATTEPNHPGLYATFIQTLLEAGDQTLNQTELYSKVKVLFKDYPELLQDFESYLDTSLEEVNDALNLAGSSSTDETMRLIEFIQKIDKLTEDCPQLKGKVMNKLKSLKDKPNSTEKDVANALEPFFVGSRVMMESFKALLPGVYKPQSASSGLDWEEIELDMEDPPKDSDELNFEVVKLPEEKTVPATSTCPCVCHTNDPDPAFSSRSKHCPKCSLKFQDGKVYIHNGRVMRPVSVELSPVKKSAAVSVSTTTASAASSRPTEQRLQKSKPPVEFKEPEKKSQSTAPSVVVQHIPPPVNPKSSFNLAPTENSDNIKQPSRTQQNTKAEETPSSSSSQAGTSDTVKVASSGQSQSEKSDVEMEWSEEEDETILRSLQEEPDLEVAFQKMAALLPNRCLDAIKRHSNQLIEIIREAQAESQSENLKE